MIVYIILAIVILIAVSGFLNHPSVEGFSARSNVDGRVYDVLDAVDENVAADQLARVGIINSRLIEFISANYREGRQGQIAQALRRRYRGVLTENDPKSKVNTSYTENKGEKIALCLRTRPARTLHHFDDVLFVNLHELAHVGCEEWGHEDEFWETFVFLQHAAVKANLYTPRDYSRAPMNYCGVEVEYNPYFDPKYQALL